MHRIQILMDGHSWTNLKPRPYFSSPVCPADSKPPALALVPCRSLPRTAHRAASAPHRGAAAAVTATAAAASAASAGSRRSILDKSNHAAYGISI